ncbi:hypothetical protein GCM10010324_04490 [Streptomyces hiroshimensis]|uniref:Alpha/beta fold hydrolase n=1 Tax=Streptomyces hiroshimensis TaxID=66424 RepID=A0ABQ2Y466_9ACTN|nr:hypothetical protein GCM10010324_04490 [Streptomyces hiroshimensis]
MARVSEKQTPQPLQYRTDGPEDGPVLVVGPALGTTWHMWDRQIPELTRHWRVLRFDLPGHGGAPAAPAPAVDELGDRLIATLDSLGVERFGYAGCSLSAAVGLDLALRHPRRLASLALVAASARYGTADSWRQRGASVRRDGLDPVARSAPERWFTANFSGAQPAIVDWAVQMVGTTDTYSYIAACDALAAFDVRAELTRISVPALVIVGAEDTTTPPADARVLVAGIHDAKLAVVPGASHLAPVEQPAAVTDLLVRHFTTAWQLSTQQGLPTVSAGSAASAASAPAPGAAGGAPGTGFGTPGSGGSGAFGTGSPSGGTGAGGGGAGGTGSAMPGAGQDGAHTGFGAPGAGGPAGAGFGTPGVGSADGGQGTADTASAGGAGAGFGGPGMPGTASSGGGAGFGAPGEAFAGQGARGSADGGPGTAGTTPVGNGGFGVPGAGSAASGPGAPGMPGPEGPGVPGSGGVGPGVSGTGFGPAGSGASGSGTGSPGSSGTGFGAVGQDPAGSGAPGAPGTSGARFGAAGHGPGAQDPAGPAVPGVGAPRSAVPGGIPGPAPAGGGTGAGFGAPGLAASGPGLPGMTGAQGAGVPGFGAPGSGAAVPGGGAPDGPGNGSAAVGSAAPRGFGPPPADMHAPAGDHERGERIRREVLGDEPVDRDAFTADFHDLVTRSAWGGAWSRPGLDRRTRALITLTALTARGHVDEIAPYTRGALRSGVTPDEIKETLLHTAVYCGLPAAGAAFAAAQRVIAEETGSGA